MTCDVDAGRAVSVLLLWVCVCESFMVSFMFAISTCERRATASGGRLVVLLGSFLTATISQVSYVTCLCGGKMKQEAITEAIERHHM